MQQSPHNWEKLIGKVGPSIEMGLPVPVKNIQSPQEMREI